MRPSPLDFVETFANDVRYATRSLARQPTLALVAIVTIGLGTAATTPVLAVRSALVDRPLRVADPSTLYLIDEIRGGAVSQPLGADAIPYERFLAYRNALDEAFVGLAADRYHFPGGFSLATDAAADPAPGYLVSGNYFDVLGLAPAAGRFFSEDDEAAVVLSHGLWQRRFGGDPAVLGSSVQIDSRPYVVVGVAPEGFHGTMHGLASDLWVPIGAHALGDGSGFDGWVTFFGRLAPGVGIEQARAAVVSAARAIPPLQPQTTVRGAVVAPLTGLPPSMAGPMSYFLTLLLATGVLVLMIAAANVAGMLLARGVGRRREVAVRLALGAGRGRLVRQSLTETLLLFLAGGVVGVGLGSLGGRLLGTMRVPVAFATSFDFRPDLGVVGIGLGVATLVGCVFGLAPSLQAARGDLLSALKLVARGAVREARGWRVFVGAQLALSVLLLVTAGLLARSLQKASAVDVGFETDGIVVAQVDVAPHGYEAERARAFFADLIERVRAVPGVTSAALADAVLLGATYGRYTNDMRALDPAETSETRVNSPVSVIEPEYFEALGIELIAGRSFGASDVPGAATAAVINETLAERLWPGQSPLGRRMSGGGQFEVVGVVRDGKYAYVGEPPTPYVFRALSQRPRSRLNLHVRAELPPFQVFQRIRGIVRELDPDVAVRAEQPLETIVGLTLFPQRFAASLVGLFGLVGLMFAGVGVYGILSFHTAQRTHEVGIRLALGGHPRHVFRELALHGVRLAGVAVGVGLLAAAFVTRLVGGLLIGVTPLDPVTFLSVGVLLMLVAAAASAAPARRATRVDPVEALRAE